LINLGSAIEMCKLLTTIILASYFILIIDGSPVYSYRYNELNQSLKKWLFYNPDVTVDDLSVFLDNWVQNGPVIVVGEANEIMTGKRTTNQQLLDYLSSRTVAVPRLKQVEQPQFIRLLPHQFGTMMGR